MSAFDDNVDALEVVEDHAKEVMDLEKRQANKIIKVYADVAAKLRARLRSVPKDSFTAQQVRVTLMQIEGALHALKGDLSEAVDIGAGLMAKRGVRDLVTEVRVFNDEFNGAVQPIRLDLVQTALDTKARLLNNYQASIDAYSKSLRDNISGQLMNRVVERVGPEVMYQRLVADDGIGKFFEGEAWKVRRIVRTELAGMYGAAKQDSLERIAEERKAAGMEPGFMRHKIKSVA